MLNLKHNGFTITYDFQHKLLRDVEDSGGNLANTLDKLGISYDDLVYKNTRELVWRGGLPLSLDDLRKNKNHIPFVSFFTGCGGMDLGFESAGFEHIAAFEFNELFCKTLRKNRPDWDIFGPPIHNGDVSKTEEIVSVLEKKISKPFDGIFIGGPPCQPFSIASNQRFSKSEDNFKRIGFKHEKNGNLLLKYVELIIEFQPKVFVIENVSGLRDLDGGEQLSSVIRMLKNKGYNVEIPFVLDAADYGVPQHRLRLFVIGSRTNKSFKIPEKHSKKIGAGSVLLNVPLSVSNHETRQHNASSLLRYMCLDYGARDQLGRVDRLNPIAPSKTVIAGGTNGGGRSHLHPDIPRTLSVRESARLQTFPDEYVFVGPTARQFTQVGNAVPPVLAAQIANKIKSIF